MPYKPVNELSKENPIWRTSNPAQAQKKAVLYLGKDTVLYRSNRRYKKYMVENPDGKWIHFGDIRYTDFTRHRNPLRRKAYLNRAKNIKGDWKKDKYSPNNLAIHILW